MSVFCPAVTFLNFSCFVPKDSQVDGVMGGKSSGELPFLESNTVMNFIGIINHLGGGGFSSVIRSFNYAIELFRVQGLWWSFWSLKLLEHNIMTPTILMSRLGYTYKFMTQLLDILDMRRHLLFHCPARLETLSKSIFLEQVLTEDRGSADYAIVR